MDNDVAPAAPPAIPPPFLLSDRFWRSWPGSCLLAAVACLVFLPAVRCDFVNWDDDSYVYENPVVLGGLTSEGVRRGLTGVFVGNWAPLTILSYQFDATVFGPRPWGFHLTNIVLHALAVALLYVALLRMTGAAGRSAAASLLFAIHPLRVESVAWVSERKDVLCVLFLMLTLLAYERYCRRPGLGRYAAVVAAMLGGLLSKSMLVTLPVLLVLVDVWPLGRLSLSGVGRPVRPGGEASPYPPVSRAWCLLEKLPLGLLSLLFVAVTLRTQTVAIRDESSLPLVSARIPNAIHSLAWYAWKTLWPTGLCPFHRHAGTALPWPVLAAGTLVVAAAAVVAVRSARRHPAVTFGLAWYAVSLVPVIGLVQVGSHGTAERYTYVPHVGLLVAVVWGLADAAAAWGVPRRALAAGTVVAAAALVVLTGRQIATWRDSETLWLHTLAVDPDNYMAHTKRGTRLRELGDDEAAERHYLAAMRSSEGATFVAAKLAGLYFDAGRFAEARELRDRAVRFDPDGKATRWIVARMRAGPPQQVSAEVRDVVRDGLREARAGRFEAALAGFQRAIDIDPRCADAHNNAGLALAELGRQDAAAAAFGRAIEVNPHNADYRMNLAQLWRTMGRWSESRRECEAALELDPTDAEARRVLAAIRQHEQIHPAHPKRPP